MQDRSAPFDSWCRLNSRHSQCGQRCSKPSFRFEPALPSSRLSNSSGKDSEGWKYGAWRIEIFLLNIWRLRIQARFSLNSLYEMTIPRIIPIFTVRNIWTPSNRSRDWGPWTENVRNARHQMQTSTWLIRLLWDAYIASLELKELDDHSCISRALVWFCAMAFAKQEGKHVCRRISGSYLRWLAKKLLNTKILVICNHVSRKSESWLSDIVNSMS